MGEIGKDRFGVRSQMRLYFGLPEPMTVFQVNPAGSESDIHHHELNRPNSKQGADVLFAE